MDRGTSSYTYTMIMITVIIIIISPFVHWAVTIKKKNGAKISIISTTINVLPSSFKCISDDYNNDKSLSVNESRYCSKWFFPPDCMISIHTWMMMMMIITIESNWHDDMPVFSLFCFVFGYIPHSVMFSLACLVLFFPFPPFGYLPACIFIYESSIIRLSNFFLYSIFFLVSSLNDLNIENPYIVYNHFWGLFGWLTV